MIRNDIRGQSFVEAMVAITIIVSSISSSLALVQSSITASRIGGTHVVAANLAREGLEVARSIRDTNWLSGRSFQVGLVDPAGKTAKPALDRSTGTWSLRFGVLTLGDAGTATYLGADGVYVQADVQPAGSAVSPYFRLLTLDFICRDDAGGAERIVADGSCLGTETLAGLAVSSAIQWVTVAGSSQTLTAEERFYDWR